MNRFPLCTRMADNNEKMMITDDGEMEMITAKMKCLSPHRVQLKQSFFCPAGYKMQMQIDADLKSAVVGLS